MKAQIPLAEVFRLPHRNALFAGQWQVRKDENSRAGTTTSRWWPRGKTETILTGLDRRCLQEFPA